MLKHKWQYDGKGPKPDGPTEYNFEPKLDSDIIDTDNHYAAAEKRIGAEEEKKDETKKEKKEEKEEKKEEKEEKKEEKEEKDEKKEEKEEKTETAAKTLMQTGVDI